MTLVPDSNPHRCTTVGIMSFRYHDHDGWGSPDGYDLPELVQCGSYLGHPEGEHICLDVSESYGERSIEWRA
jgi:hypothetical protein